MRQRTGIESLHGSCQGHRITGEPRGPSRHQRSQTAGSTDCVAGGLPRLCLEEVNHICGGHPLERVPLPAPLDHVPHAVRDFGMIRPRWSVVLEDCEDYCSFDISGERGLSGEDLVPANEYPEVERHTKNRLTSQASIANANMSVDLVVRAWTNPKACGLMSSGAIPQNNLSASTSDQLAGSERAKADPMPPRRATPSLSTNTFLLNGVSTLWQ
jgi:hypothetical protein